jgi:hypothetical protein
VSRYKIQVRQADSLHGTFACDSVYVDDGGDLHVNRKHSGNDLLTIARFQHGHWSSYELEPTADPDVEAWLREGVMTREQFLGRVHGLVDDSADEPVEAEALPEVGSVVHLWRDGDNYTGCTLMPVAQHLPADDDDPGGLLLGPAVRPDRWPHDFTHWLTRTHDETRTQSGSWHYADHGDGRDVEPEPVKPAPPTVTINISAAVMSPADIADAINKQMRAAWSGYGTTRR